VGDDVGGPVRPVGWWVKEADRLLDQAFDDALAGTGVDRRGWQVLATAARQPVGRADLLDALAAFDAREVLERAVAEVAAHGWIEDTEGALRLTPAGRAQHEALRTRVDDVRRRVSASLPPGDYAQLVDLLARLVAGLGHAR
jgi:hypothetical protein